MRKKIKQYKLRLAGSTELTDTYLDPADAVDSKFDAANEDDREERGRGWGKKKIRAAFYAVIGEYPACAAADHATARTYLNKIHEAQAMKGSWSKSEVGRLSMIEKKWRERAEGRNWYFELYGTKVGANGGSGSGRSERVEPKVIAKIKQILWMDQKKAG